MATIYWRADRAYLNWSEAGQQHRKSLGRINQRDAEIARRQKEIEVRSGRRFSPSALFDALADKYIEWHRHEYPDSHQRIAQIVEQYLCAEFGSRPIGGITPEEIDDWKRRRLRTGAASETVAKELRTLNAMLNRAKRWRMLDRNPCDDVEPPKNLHSEPIHWYSKAELDRLYAASPNHADIWRLMANTGIRRREALQLKWDRVLPERIRIVSREGARTKSGKWRDVPLSESAQVALLRLRIGAGPSGHVIPHVHRASLSRAFRTCQDRAGLDGSLHSLRHTFASHLVSQGVPLRTVQVLMGHASITTTERYASLAPGHLQSAVAHLDL